MTEESTIFKINNAIKEEELKRLSIKEQLFGKELTLKNFQDVLNQEKVLIEKNILDNTQDYKNDLQRKNAIQEKMLQSETIKEIQISISETEKVIWNLENIDLKKSQIEIDYFKRLFEISKL